MLLCQPQQGVGKGGEGGARRWGAFHRVSWGLQAERSGGARVISGACSDYVASFHFFVATLARNVRYPAQAHPYYCHLHIVGRNLMPPSEICLGNNTAVTLGGINDEYITGAGKCTAFKIFVFLETWSF